MPMLLIFTALFVIFTSAANAQSGPAGFQSPSKNIACQYFDYDKQNTLRCDIGAMETKPRRPVDCELDWGGAFEMNAKGPAARICHGDTVVDNSLPTLAYGEVWQRGGFTCKSEQTGTRLIPPHRSPARPSRPSPSPQASAPLSPRSSPA